MFVLETYLYNFMFYLTDSSYKSPARLRRYAFDFSLKVAEGAWHSTNATVGTTSVISDLLKRSYVMVKYSSGQCEPQTAIVDENGSEDAHFDHYKTPRYASNAITSLAIRID